MKRRILGLILALSMLVAFVPVIASADTMDGGLCGEGIRWHIDSEGTLTISGEGEMADYDNMHDIVPWASRRAEIKTIIVESGVTKIGQGAFEDCAALTSVTIPEGVTYINTAAFFECKALTGVSLPKSLTAIGWSAFCGCSALTEIIIPDNVTEIDSYAFYECTGLKSVTIPESVTKINSFAFCLCSQLTEITIPKSVTSLNNSAFWECDNLSIEVSADNPNYASADGVLFNKDKTQIILCPCGKNGEYAMPQSVTEIGTFAFAQSALTRVIIPDGVKEIGIDAFVDCALTEITIPKSVTAISGNVFRGSQYLTEINVDADNPNYTSADGALFNKNKTQLIAYPSGRKGAYTIGGSVKSIELFAFYECVGITEITIPDSVEKMSFAAFFGCTALTKAVMGKGLTTISNSAFEDCSVLKTVCIPSSVELIEKEAFAECNVLTDVYYDGDENDWGNIQIEEKNQQLTDANIHYLKVSPSFSVTGNNVTNLLDRALKCSIIMAEYSQDGVLEKVSCRAAVFAANETQTFGVSANGRIFVWDSLAGMKPLAN